MEVGDRERRGQPVDVDLHPLQPPDERLHVGGLGRIVVANEVVADGRVGYLLLDRVLRVDDGVRLELARLALDEGFGPGFMPLVEDPLLRDRRL